MVTSAYHYTHNGSPLEDLSDHLNISPSENDSNVIIIRAYSRLMGGKGGKTIFYMYGPVYTCHVIVGFGALIRAMGMRMNRNRNKDACRDLTGRRLRTVNAEKK